MEAITAGVIATNGRKSKAAAGTDKAFSYFSSTPLSQEMDPATPLMAEEEEKTKVNSADPPGLWRCQKRGNKGETLIIRNGRSVLLIFLHPMSQEAKLVTPFMAEEEDEPKENPPTPPDLGGANNAATKEKQPSPGTDEVSSFFSSDPCLGRHIWRHR